MVTQRHRFPPSWLPGCMQQSRRECEGPTALPTSCPQLKENKHIKTNTSIFFSLLAKTRYMVLTTLQNQEKQESIQNIWGASLLYLVYAVLTKIKLRQSIFRYLGNSTFGQCRYPCLDILQFKHFYLSIFKTHVGLPHKERAPWHLYKVFQ